VSNDPPALLIQAADALLGTTLIYIPTSAYNKFLSAAGGSTDQNTGLAKFSRQPTGTITFTIGGKGLTLSPAQYLVPKAQYSSESS
jgi:hypothetical protein